MRKHLGVIIGVAMWAGVGGADDLQGQRVELALKGGLNSGSIAWSQAPNGDGPENVERRDGRTFGAAATFPGPGNSRIRIEGLLTEKGFFDAQTNGITTQFELDYLEIPVLVGWALADLDSRLVPELYAGPWLAFETGCRAGYETVNEAADFDCDDFPDGAIERQTKDWGFAVGGMLNLAVSGPVRALVDLRYTAGLRNIDTDPDLSNSNVRHRGVAVTVGFGFVLGS